MLAVLQRREEPWTFGLIEQKSRARGNTPEEQLLAIFDVLHEWFQSRDGYEGCSFINVLLELGADPPPGGRASATSTTSAASCVNERWPQGCTTSRILPGPGTS